MALRWLAMSAMSSGCGISRTGCWASVLGSHQQSKSSRAAQSDLRFVSARRTRRQDSQRVRARRNPHWPQIVIADAESGVARAGQRGEHERRDGALGSSLRTLTPGACSARVRAVR
jgi:hypothetical protein